MGSIANVDQHKILIPLAPNTIGFTRETNSTFRSWSHDTIFKGQLSKNGQKSAIGSVANVDQHKILFSLTPYLIEFVSNYFSPITSRLRD